MSSNLDRSMYVVARLRRVASLVVALCVGVLSLLVVTSFAAPASAAAPTLTEVGARAGGGNGKQHRVAIPAAVDAGDRLVLFLTADAKTGLSGPSGWTAIETRKGKRLTARAWTRKATAADAGRELRIKTTKSVKTALAVVAYASTGTGATVTASTVAGSNAARRNLTSPRVSVKDSGSWLVNAWTAASKGNPAWKLPASSTKRVLRSTSGKQRVSVVVGDSRRAVATGTASGRRATTSKKLAGSAAFSVVVSPGAEVTTDPGDNTAPQAAFAAPVCDELACDFDASGSSDADGDALTYAWEFGDGAAGNGVAPQRTYAAADTYDVTLTVSDGTDSDTATRQVTVTDDPTVPPSGDQPVPGHSRLAPETADQTMPRIEDGEIWDIEVVGNRAYIVGTFTQIRDAAGDTAWIQQPRIAAWNLTTGKVDRAFRPTFDSAVEAVEASPDGTKLYVAGQFNTVNGVTKRKIASINPATGAPVAGFTANANSRATALAASNSAVYVGGRFKTVNNTTMNGLAAVNGTTGALDTGFDNQLSGGLGINGLLTVQQLKLTHDNSKLIVVHTARKIDGEDRFGVGLIDTATKQLLPWKTSLWEDNLQYVGGIQRIYGGDVAPDDSYFVVTSGSGGDRPPINDTAIAFRLDGNAVNNTDAQPTWISRAFDSIYSVAITEQAVYLGGHFQWNESPTAPDPWPGLDNVGYGTGQGLAAYALGDAVVRRDHLGALNPADGKALEWHPGSDSFEGNKAMIATERGLITGGDAKRQGGGPVGRIGFFDFADAPAATNPDTTITGPIAGRVVEASKQFDIEGTATSANPLTRVQVEVARGSQYLQDDMTWSSTFHTFDADLGARSGQRTPWSLPVTVPDSADIILRARAVAPGGTDTVKATKKIESFRFDDLPPSTSISASSTQTSTSFVLRGSASDDNGVTAISFYVRDDDGRYLNSNGDLVPDYTTIRISPDLVGAVNTSWQYELTLPHEGHWKVGASAIDTAGQTDTRGAAREFNVSSTGQAPTVTIGQPIAVTPPVQSPTITMAPGNKVTFSGTAVDDDALATVEVVFQNTTTRENLSADGVWGTDVSAGWRKISPANMSTSSYNWTFTSPANLVPGQYNFQVRASDKDDLTTSSSLQGRVSLDVSVPGDAAPNGLLDVTGTQVSSVRSLNLTGTATDDIGVDGVRVAIRETDSDKYLRANGTLGVAYGELDATVATRGATSSTWSLPVALPVNGSYSITAYAVDSAGQRDRSTSGATATYRVYPGDAVPMLAPALASPPEGAAFTDSKIVVSGRADDDQAMARVEVAIVNAAGQYMSGSGSFGTSERWNAAFLNSPGSPGSNYSYTTPVLPDGAYKVRVRPIDNHGLMPDPREVNVTVTAPAGNNAPVAVAKVSCAANVCTFDGRDSTDESKSTLSYSWSFGNTRTGSGGLTTHTYTGPGTFTPTLTVRDEYGLTHTATMAALVITEPAGNRAPDAVITQPTCVGLVCNFSGGTSTDPDTGDTISYSWDFGDGGATSTSTSPSRTFPAAGPYTVTLTVTDGWGNVDAATRTVNVTQ